MDEISAAECSMADGVCSLSSQIYQEQNVSKETESKTT